MNRRKSILSILLLVGILSQGIGQNLSQFKKKDPINFTGNLSLALRGYQSDRANPTGVPFSYTLSARPVLSLYGFRIPMTLVYSENERSFRQPFNRFGIRPTYKGLTLYAGHSNVYFSDYTLSGRTFFGGGMELDAGGWRLGAVYGQFNRKVELSSSSEFFIEPSFDREGMAFKLGFGKESNYFDLIFLKAADKFDETLRDTLRKSKNPPAENSVFGVKSSKRLFKIFTIDLDAALSAYTQNVFSDSIPDERLQFIKDFYETKISSRIVPAGKASLTLNLSKLTLGLGYRRIYPEFQSMGAYTFLSDVEDITLNPSFRIFKNKVSISGAFGLQRNNLFNTKARQSVRRIGSGNLNALLNRNISANFSYSNFKVDVSTVSEDILSDTFNLVQVNQNFNGNFVFQFGPKFAAQSLSFTGFFQGLNDLSPFLEIGSESTALGGFAAYRINFKERKLNLGLTGNWSRFEALTSTADRLGGGLNLTKKIGKILRLKIGTDFYLNSKNGIGDGQTFRIRASANASLKGGHSLYFNSSFINRSYESSLRNSFYETRGTLQYNFRFSALKNKNK